MEAAKNAVRNFKSNGVNLAQSIEIIIGDVVYSLDKTLELEPEDSGSKSTIITWRAAENEKVILMDAILCITMECCFGL